MATTDRPSRERRTTGVGPYETDRVVDPRAREPVGAPPPGGGWRDQVATVAGLNVLAGIWLIIAPWVLAYTNGDPYWNDVLFGALIAIFALGRLLMPAQGQALSIANMLFGAWIFASAFWLDSSGTASGNDIVLGAIVFVLALIGATTPVATRRPRDPAAPRTGI